MSSLARRLGPIEALSLSLSLIGPSMATSFNVSLVARVAGTAAPLAFAIGSIALAIVALSFVSFGRRVPHAGSVYAYISQAFGQRWGFVAGWTLLLTYLTYAIINLAGTAAEAGDHHQPISKDYPGVPS
jgi:amino acid transporter